MVSMDSVKSPFVIVIFGATGDLTYHKLMPAIFEMFKKGSLPEDFFIIGFSRRQMSDSDFTNFFENINIDPKWDEFSKHLSYDHGTFEGEEGYQTLIETLNALDKKMGACITRFFYLATPPQHYEVILDHLKTT